MIATRKAIVMPILLCGSMLLLGGCLVGEPYVDPVTSMRERIEDGTPMSEAASILAENAYHSAICPLSDTYEEHLYFYGSRVFDRAKLAIVGVSTSGDVPIVTNIGSFEPYIWQKMYQDCYDATVFEEWHEVPPWPLP